MDFIKIRFGNDFKDVKPNFDKVVEEMFRSINPMFSLYERSWKPQMDIYETPDDIYILAEISGVDKDNLEIEINRKAVRIYGQRDETPRDDNMTYRLAEIQYGKFERILFLPSPIDTEKVTAAYKDGMLKIRLAKMPRDKTFKIPISED